MWQLLESAPGITRFAEHDGIDSEAIDGQLISINLVVQFNVGNYPRKLGE
jgi:hypothetical protein